MSSSRFRLRRLGRWRRVGGAALLTAAVVLVAIAPGAPAASSAKRAPTITMSGSTSVAPLAAKLAKKYVKQQPQRAVQALAGRLRHRHLRRRPRPGDDRQLVA